MLVNTTYEFSQWFIKEQVEEEEKFRNFIFKMNLDMPDYEIDDMFKL
jgi:ferritin